MEQKMPCEVNRQFNAPPYSVTLYPCRTAGGNVDLWYSVTVYFARPSAASLDEVQPARVGMSGTQVSPAVAVRMGQAIMLAGTLAELGHLAIPATCHELSEQEKEAYYAEKKAAKKSAQEAR